MQKNLSYSAHQLVAGGAFAFFCFPMFYMIWTYQFPQIYDNLGLRLMGSFLGLGLMLTPYWPERCKHYLSWYWFFTLLFILPFFFTFLFLMNKASMVSAMSLLCSVFLLVQLVDLISLTIFLLLGCGLALGAYYIVSPSVYFSQEHLGMSLVMLFTIFAGSTLNYKTTLLQQQKLAGIASAAGMIAHELRTPLLGIKSGAQALIQYLPGLIQGYQLAKDHDLIPTPLRDRRLLQLHGISDRIVNEIDYANAIIEMSLVKAGRENFLRNCPFEICSILDCTNEGMARYPFQSANDRRFITHVNDFQFKGSNLLMQHVLFNLIKNALYVIATVQRGEIYIWTEFGEKFNYLYFKDTAVGLTKQQTAQLFNHFYTTTFMGTGIGLPFCKMVMNGFGGDIACEAREGEFTQFKLSFPVITL